MYTLQLNCNLVKTIHFQLLFNSIITTPMIMLMSLIIIHLLKFDTWHYEDFLTLKKFVILIPSSITIVNNDLRL
jgi:hypothetical protein